ncbi:MAG: NfeD family protein [Eubacterium sp.]|nr:NfeD family protein [Eubacterium sp.]
MPEFLLSPIFLWLALMVIFIIVEIITVGLTSIWFAGGALVSLISALVGWNVMIQVILFFAVSFVLLFCTRPFALKYVKPHNVKTNYEEMIGKEVRVTERIDNRNGTGTAVCNGQEWTARSAADGHVIEAGTTAQVVEIKGVKLYVKS